MEDTAQWVRRMQNGGLFYSLGGFDLNMGAEQLKAMPSEIS